MGMTDYMDDIFSDDDESFEELKKECEEAGLDSSKKLLNQQEVREFDRKLTTNLPKSIRELAVSKGLIPKKYQKAEFNEEIIRSNIAEQDKKTKGIYSVVNFDNYLKTCYGLISTFRTGSVPARSYLIGAPNGFGKTSLIEECIITMEDKGMRTAPYVSLFELANLKVLEEQRLMNQFTYKNIKKPDSNTAYVYTDPETSEFIKEPVEVVGRYSWSEFMNADCLFTSLTDISSKQIESRVLYHILNIRGQKGLPTIVTVGTSMVPYKNDVVLKEQVWDEIIEYQEESNSYDRLYHISCYKKRKNPIADAGRARQ